MCSDSPGMNPANGIARMVEAILCRAKTAAAKRPSFGLAAAFCISHAIFYMLGVRFDDDPLGGAWQYLDPELLRHNLLESLLYLHVQPPLFNLFLGTVLKFSFGHPKLVFQGIYLVCGLILYCGLFSLQVRLGVGKRLAFALSTLFMISPSFILYEHWLFYTFPVAAVLLLSALLLHEFLVKTEGRQAFLFFLSLFVLSGIRTVFHLAYFMATAGVLLAVSWPNRKRIILAAALPFVLVASLYCKNLLLFGGFNTSSWLGVNAWSVATNNVPWEERQQLVAEGKLSELSLIGRFSPLAKYPVRYRQVKGFENIASLRQLIKSTGSENFNHLAYVGISNQYFEDFLSVLRERPKAYINGLLKSWLTYFKSSSDHGFLEENRERISLLNDIYDSFFYGKIPCDVSKTGILPFFLIPGYRVHVLLLLGLPLLLIFALGLSLRRGSKGQGQDRNQRIVTLYLCGTIAFVAFVGNLFELGENNRFRFTTDPFSVVLLGLFIQFFVGPRLSRALCAWRRKKRAQDRRTTIGHPHSAENQSEHPSKNDGQSWPGVKGAKNAEGGTRTPTCTITH